jgi:hypothetical protein
MEECGGRVHGGRGRRLSAFEIAEDESVAGIAKGRRDALLMNVGEAGHGIEPAAADDSDFCLLQYGSLQNATHHGEDPMIRIAVDALR